MLGGAWSLLFTFSVSVVGSFVGLVCVLLARRRGGGTAWAGWLTLGAVFLGGVGIWATHFGTEFDGLARVDVARAAVSAALSISVVFLGLLMFGARFSVWRLGLGGVSVGLTAALVHYLDTSGPVLWLPAAIAVVAATMALSFTVLFDSVLLCGLAGVIMGFAVTGTHYAGMTRADPTAPAGVEALTFLFPVMFLALVIPICAVLVAATRSDVENRRRSSVPARPVTRRPEPGRATHTVAQVRGVGQYARLPTIPVQRP